VRLLHRPAPLTARAAILAVAVASVLVALAVPFKVWLNQRDDIASLSATAERVQHHVQQLSKQRQRWHDPAYVQQQAQQRFHYVMPGQRSYIVLGKSGAKSGAKPGSATTPAAHGPWYSQLWQSLQAAGEPANGSH
jgi:cell division protein FtsB